ncbi:unnamed protein product [Calicophoron daubneyi]|uniref:Symplekin n=1 Tax=Calicophoron daubneyi TaxID=300641 RepID=A0AAV2U1M6_CALDB
MIESGVAVGNGTGIPADSAADVALETFRSVAGLKDEVIRLVLPLAVPGPPAFKFSRPLTLNDSTRTAAISLIESVIILHSRRLPNSDIPRSNEGDISLDQIPDLTNAQLQAVLESSTAASSATLLPGVCLVRPRRLSEEAERLFSGLIGWPLPTKSSMSPGPVSCSVLEAIMDAMVTVARQRPQFMDRVVQAYETVHVTLPPHFSDTQVSAVRKKLKSGLLQLLRNSTAVADYQGRITILLTDLGATQNEVLEALHSRSEFSRFLGAPNKIGAESSLSESVDHGDVDMRRLPSRMQPTGPSSVSVPCSVGGNVNQKTTDQGLSLPPQKPIYSRSQTSLPHSSGSTTVTDTMPSVTTSTTKAPPSPFPDGFSLAEAEAALRFDDDDDDDDDMQIIRTRRPRASKRQLSSSATTKPTATPTPADVTKFASDSKINASSGKAQLELPQVDFVTNRLVPRLTTANVADLVLLSMVTLPDQMPAAFQSTYTPIAAAGTSAQIRHLARMLAVQLVVWAGESNHANPTENLSQLESLLRPTREEQAERTSSGYKRGSNSEANSVDALNSSANDSKKRRLSSVGSGDAEAEDALIRANAARKLHGAQPMNISTLVGYGQQQQQQQQSTPTSTEPPSFMSNPPLIPGLPPMFSSVPPPNTPAQNLLLAGFNPAQPPPPLLMVPPPTVPSGTNAAAFGQLAPVASSIPAAALSEVTAVPTLSRPFSLDAITMPLPRPVQRQLARDAFMRIIEGLEIPSVRRTGTVESHTTSVNETASAAPQLGRMKLLTRLTTRRFGGNEFYSILIDNAIKNLRYGFELLSKLLMQEYCRFRGFQLVGFTPFLESRRQQLEALRERQKKMYEAEEELGDEEGKKIESHGSPVSSRNTNDSDDRLVKTQPIFTLEQSRRASASVTNAEEEEDYLMAEDNIELVEADDTALGEDSNDIESSAALAAKHEDADEDHPSSPSNEKDRIKIEASSEGGQGDKSNSRSTRSATSARKPEKSGKALMIASPDDLGCLSFYDCLLIDILQRLSSPDIRQTYFGRFLIEAPLLTPGAISVLKRYCWTASQSHYGFQVLRTLIELRPVGQREDLLNMLLNFCAVEDAQIRQAALAATRDLASLDPKWQYYIETFATRVLKKLLQPRPTADIYPFGTQPIVPANWTDEACQVCAHLFLGLMPQSPSLMHKLADVYVEASPQVKRCILRMVDTPIREIGIYSQDLHDLVDQCPIGAETLITRMIHLLTDSPSAIAAAAAAVAAAVAASKSVTPGNPPVADEVGIISKPAIQLPQATATTPAAGAAPPPVIVPPASLVERVYRLYRERVHDVRCLIPILVGLSKQEVIGALPRLVQLNEKVVKEVLTRLLHASVSTQYAPKIASVQNVVDMPDLSQPAPLGPLKPEELLVAVHLLEFAKDPSAPVNESKPSKPYVNLSAILHACRVCFAERRLLTQERLSAAIGQMLEQPVLPTLFMRTVMQALALHPRLAGYVINVLVRLIRKQVWKSDKLWDGFIRCCIKTRPQSYQVLLQLPPERLEAVFQRESTMRAQVRRYVENFSSAQRTHISKSIIEILERVPTPPPPSTPPPESSEHTESNPPVDASEELPISPPPSPASSGPATPTRDEIPRQNVSLALAAAAAMFGSTGPSSSATHFTSEDAAMHRVQSMPSTGISLPSGHSFISTTNSPRQSQPTVSRERSPFGNENVHSQRSAMHTQRAQRQEQITPKKESGSRSSGYDGEESITEDQTSSAHYDQAQSSHTDHDDSFEFQSDHASNRFEEDDDDMEPPILPASRVLPPRRWRNLERPQQDEAESSGLGRDPHHQSMVATGFSSESDSHGAGSHHSRSRRPVDIDKLEADRKRLEEEALKYKQLRAERKLRKNALNLSSSDGNEGPASGESS